MNQAVRWRASVIAAALFFSSIVTFSPAQSLATPYRSADGQTEVSDPVLPWIPKGSSSPTQISATVTTRDTGCTPCSVNFYLHGYGWVYPSERHLSNGGTATFIANAPTVLGEYPVDVVLYGPGHALEAAIKDVGTLVVGGLVGPAAAGDEAILPGQATAITAKLVVQSTDGSTSAAPKGTPFGLEHRPDGASQWSTMGSGSTESGGLAVSSVSPQASGEWRVRSNLEYGFPVRVEIADVLLTDANVSRRRVPAGVRTTVSAAIEAWSISGTQESIPDGTPFELQYRQANSAVWKVVTSGQVNQGRAVANVVPLQTGQWRIASLGASSQPYSVTVGPAVGTDLFRLNSIHSNKPAVIEGGRVSVSGAISEKYTDGLFRPAQSGKPFVVQFRPVGHTTAPNYAWARVGSGVTTSTGLARASVRLPRSGYLRLSTAGKTSKSTLLQVIEPTRVSAFGRLRVSRRTVVKGLSTRLTSPVKVRYADGLYRPASVGTAFKVQFAPTGSNAWRTVRRSEVRDRGRASVTVRIERSGRWRLTRVSKSSNSRAVRALPIRPARIKAFYFETDQGSTLTVTAYVQANNGRKWAHRTSLVLQYRASRNRKWRDLDRDYQNSRRIALMKQDHRTGYYRVVAPALDFRTREHIE